MNISVIAEPPPLMATGIKLSFMPESQPLLSGPGQAVPLAERLAKWLAAIPQIALWTPASRRGVQAERGTTTFDEQSITEERARWDAYRLRATAIILLSTGTHADWFPDAIDCIQSFTELPLQWGSRDTAPLSISRAVAGMWLLASIEDILPFRPLLYPSYDDSLTIDVIHPAHIMSIVHSSRNTNDLIVVSDRGSTLKTFENDAAGMAELREAIAGKL